MPLWGAVRARSCPRAHAATRRTRCRPCSYPREAPREPRLLGMKLHHLLTVSMLAAIAVSCWSGGGGLAAPV